MQLNNHNNLYCNFYVTEIFGLSISYYILLSILTQPAVSTVCIVTDNSHDTQIFKKEIYRNIQLGVQLIVVLAKN